MDTVRRAVVHHGRQVATLGDFGAVDEHGVGHFHEAVPELVIQLRLLRIAPFAGEILVDELDNAYFLICSCLNAKLIETNDQLIANPQLVQSKPSTQGYVFILMPKLDNLKEQIAAMVTHEAYTATKDDKGVAWRITNKKYYLYVHFYSTESIPKQFVNLILDTHY